MKEVAILIGRIIAGLGAVIFLVLAVVAVLMIFFQHQYGGLVLDGHGPDWRYGRIALGCVGTSVLWGLAALFFPWVGQLPRLLSRLPRHTESKTSIGMVTTTVL